MFLLFGGSPEVAEYCETRNEWLIRIKKTQLGLMDKERSIMYSVVVGAHEH